MLAQHELVEARGHLVVLLVRFIGRDGDGHLLEPLDVLQQGRALSFDRGLLVLAQRLRKAMANAHADHRIGEDVFGEEGVDRAHAFGDERL